MLKLQHLTKQFGAAPLFTDLCMEVDAPVVLWASSGWGKTTLLRILMGLERPTTGSVEGVGRVAAVFQEDRLCPQLNAVQNVTLVLPGAENQYKEQITSDFQQLGMDTAALQLPARRLSGGQKRRVAIAGVMAMEPKILVLDEPAAGLDPEGRDTILSQIRNYHEQTGITVILVSHSMEDIARYANRVLVMSKAKVAMYDTVEKVFARAPELLELGLSVPQVTQVFLMLKAMGMEIDTDVYTVPYAVKTVLKAWNAKHPDKAVPLPQNHKTVQEGGAD